MSFFITQQTPIFPPKFYGDNLYKIVTKIVVRLSYTSWSMKEFAKEFGYDCDPFPWNPEQREQDIAWLDALYFHFYRISRDDVIYVMDTFTIQKRSDLKRYGTYKTLDLILKYYDELISDPILKDVNYEECRRLVNLQRRELGLPEISKEDFLSPY